jgi:hypothetical protein
MELVAVRCTHCGAPLEVGAQTRFATCRFCSTQLEVKRTDSAVFTEEVARIARNTEVMAENLETIRLQNEIERLDREWLVQHPLMAPDPSGQVAPTTGGAMLRLGFSVFFAVVCFGMAGFADSFGAPGLFKLVPIGMGVFAIGFAIVGLARSSSLERARAEYDRQRGELVRQLDAQKRD